jgi:hypothetical protein
VRSKIGKDVKNFNKIAFFSYFLLFSVITFGQILVEASIIDPKVNLYFLKGIKIGNKIAKKGQFGVPKLVKMFIMHHMPLYKIIEKPKVSL